MREPQPRRRAFLTWVAGFAIVLVAASIPAWPAHADDEPTAPPVAPSGAADPAPEARQADKPKDAVGWLNAMHWIDGAWIGRMGPMAWEAAYTSGKGAERFSINKVLQGGRVVSYEVERFHVKDKRLVMTPFPDGKEAASFTLDIARSSTARMIFTNPANAFPKQLIYAKTTEGGVRIELGAVIGDGVSGPALLLTRQP